MSYILDALKKVEHDKLKKSSPGGMTSITGDLFQVRFQQPAKSGYWKIIVLIGVASVITFAGTWFVLKSSKPKSIPLPSDRPTATAPIAVPVVLKPVTATVQQAVPLVTAPAVSVSGEDQNETASSRSTKRSIKVTIPQSLRPSAPQTQPPADMKLSGIAWQEEHSARRAVINGFLLKEGAVVSGAKVAEILPDKVKFSTPTGFFELRLDTAPVAEVKR